MAPLFLLLTVMIVSVFKYRLGKRMKKGTILDLPIISISILISGMLLFVALEVSYSMDNQPQLNQTFIEQGRIGVRNAGISFPFWSVGLGVVSVILAFIFGGSPALVVTSIIFMGFTIMLNAMFANAFEIFMGEFTSAIINDLAPVVFMEQYMPLYALAFGALIAIAYHSGRSRDLV